MKCDVCGEEQECRIEKIPSGFGVTKLVQICDWCMGELEDEWDVRREERRIKVGLDE